MTLEEAIKHADEVVEYYEPDATIWERTKQTKINIEEIAHYVAEKTIQELRDDGVFVGRWIPVIDTNSVIENIKSEISSIYCGQYCENPMTADEVRERTLDIIDKYKSESEE